MMGRLKTLCAACLLMCLIVGCQSSVQDFSSQLESLKAAFKPDAAVSKGLYSLEIATWSKIVKKGTAEVMRAMSKTKVQMAGFDTEELPYAICDGLVTSPSARATQVVVISKSASEIGVITSVGSSVFEEIDVNIAYLTMRVKAAKQATRPSVHVTCDDIGICTETNKTVARGFSVAERQSVNTTAHLDALDEALRILQAEKGNTFAEQTEAQTSGWPPINRLWKDYFMMRHYFGVVRAEITYMRNLNFADVIPMIANLTHGEDDVSWYRKNFEYNIDVNKRFRLVFVMEKQATGVVVLEVGKEGSLFDLAVGLFYTNKPPSDDYVVGTPSRLPSSYNAVVGTNRGITVWDMQYHKEDFWPGSQQFAEMFCNLATK